MRATLTARHATLEALAKRLIDKEVVEREALLALIAAGHPGETTTPA